MRCELIFFSLNWKNIYIYGILGEEGRLGLKTVRILCHMHRLIYAGHGAIMEC